MKEGPYIPHLFGEKVKEIYVRYTKWLICNIHHSIGWPENDILIQYDNNSYILRGLKENDVERQASIVVPLKLGEDTLEVLKGVYKLVSMLGWFKGGYVDVVYHTEGSLSRNITTKQPFAPSMVPGLYGFNCNYMPIIKDEEARKALAFWREGLKLKNIHTGYSFLSFYKVIESQFSTGKHRGNWINNTLQKLTDKAKERVDELVKVYGSYEKTGEYIYKSGRCAVAHATVGDTIVDPDIPEDKIRLEKDLIVVQALAQEYIRSVHCVPNELEVLRDRDALEAIYPYLQPNILQDLRNRISVLRRSLRIDGIKLKISCWPSDASPQLRDLKLKVKNAHNGKVDVVVVNNSDTLFLGFTLDFVARKAFVNWDLNRCLVKSDTRIDFLKYERDVIKNGAIEIEFRLLPVSVHSKKNEAILFS